MFDPKAFSMAQMRCEEMRRKADFEHSIGWYDAPTPWHKHMLATIGRRMIAWGAALENRYGEVKQQTGVSYRPSWRRTGNRMERAL